jgi:hypothetical protein
LTEDFEAGSPPAGWSRSQNTPSVGWEFGTDLGSQYFPIAAHSRYTASNDDAHDDQTNTANLADQDYLISPELDFTVGADDGILLRFSYVQPNVWGSVGTVELQLSGGAWIVVATVPPVTEWTEIEIDLSVFSPNHSVKVGFHHNDNGGWSDGFAVDDVIVSTNPVIDGAMDQLLTAGYLPIGLTDIEGVVSNQGDVTITSVDLAYRINGGAIVNGTIGGLSLAPGDAAVVVHPVPAQLPTVATYQIEMSITAVNGAPDGDATNDSSASQVETVSRVPPKYVILSNHTGSWCGFCPDGYVWLEEALDLHGNLIGISIHRADGMTFPDGDLLNTLYIDGYPTGLIDIYRFPEETGVNLSRSSWNDRAGERLSHIVPIAVALEYVSYDSATRTIDATVRAEFFGRVQADLRFNVWIVEDGVTGSGSGFDQVNYYNSTPGHPYYGAGDPIIGFVHDRTLRAMLGGTWGTSGIIPSTVSDGEVYTHDYTFVLPAEYDETRISMIGLVATYDPGDIENRAILNSDQKCLWGIFDDGFEWGDTADWTSTLP